MNQLAPEKLSEFRQMNKEEKQSAIDDFLEKYKAKHSQDAKKTETEEDVKLVEKEVVRAECEFGRPEGSVLIIGSV